MMLTLSFAASAQCAEKNVSFPGDGNTITLSGNTGGCQRYAFSITAGQKVLIKLASADGRARFDLQNGDDDETGSIVYPNQANFNGELKTPDWMVNVKGSAATSFTLTITVADE